MACTNAHSEFNFHKFKYYTDEEIHIQIQNKFSKIFDLNLIISGLCSIILPFYNVFIIYQNFYVYRNSFSGSYYQIVTYFEFGVINFLLIFGIVRISYYWHNSIGQRLFYFHRFLSNLQFNLFSLVPYLSIYGIYSLFSKARDRGELESEHCMKQAKKEAYNTAYYKSFKLLTTVIYLIIYANLLLLIIFSVLSKLSMVSFVGTLSIDQWSFDQIFLFIGIVNNLASVSRDDESTLDFMWTILNDEWDVDKNQWKCERLCSFRMWRLYEMMYEVHRWKALMWIGTMNGRELHDLVRQP